MSRYLIHVVVFLAGLAAVCWVAAGYVLSGPLALAVTLLIGAGYLTGVVELKRYEQATATLMRAVGGLSDTPPKRGAWLERLHPSLRNAVRLRVEGERAGLPGPALTPYLVGLLVLLGMLGTLLGMVVTLRGTGAALQSATDLEAMRASLAVPVRGLGFAFGTSIAGVAASAMLGLLSALVRRERAHVAQALDLAIATTLRVYSQAHQREQALALMQQQAAVMPALVDRLQSMMTAIEQQSLAASERQLASQDAFHRQAEGAYVRLAASVDQSLRLSVSESARAANAALQPVMEATMAGLAREAGQLHESVAQAVQRQLEGLSGGFEASTAKVAELWQEALAAHRQSSEALTENLQCSLGRFAESFEQRSTALGEAVSARMQAVLARVSETWDAALARQQQAGDQLAHGNRLALTTAAGAFEQQAAALLRTITEAQQTWQAESASRDDERLAAWTARLTAMAAGLNEQWEQAGARTSEQQRQICDALARMVSDISAQTKTHASETIAEIGRLMHAASQAPKAAAEVVAELRAKLSDSMARDTAMLEERSRLLATVETLLGAVNHASTEQRTAIDTLVVASAELLDRVGGRFGATVEAETARLAALAAQLTGSAVEVASLGESLGAAVQVFGESNEKLMTHLQRIEAALDKSLSRSDEQLAYYVTQAREVIELSMLSHKQIVDEMQRLAAHGAAAGAETA